MNFLRKTTSAEECENALVAAEDMLNIRYSRKKKHIDEEIDQIDGKITRLRELLPVARKKDLLTEKEMLLERAENITKMEIHEDKTSKIRFEQCKRRLARNLVEENRVR